MSFRKNAELYHNWSEGVFLLYYLERIEVRMPFSLRLESMPDDPKRVTILFGPHVLAGDLGPEHDPKVKNPMYLPVLIDRRARSCKVAGAGGWPLFETIVKDKGYTCLSLMERKKDLRL